MFAVFVGAAAAAASAIGVGKSSTGERGGDNWTRTRDRVEGPPIRESVSWLVCFFFFLLVFTPDASTDFSSSLFLGWALPRGGERNIR
jgi:hypothetical protein